MSTTYVEISMIIYQSLVVLDLRYEISYTVNDHWLESNYRWLRNQLSLFGIPYLLIGESISLIYGSVTAI